MTKSIDAVLQNSEFDLVISGTPFERALEAWESGSKNFIERMRKEFLQFRSESRPNALFSSNIDPADTVTKRNLQQLAQTLRVSGLRNDGRNDHFVLLETDRSSAGVRVSPDPRENVAGNSTCLSKAYVGSTVPRSSR